jgi:uncharacterized protein (DUF58 family)
MKIRRKHWKEFFIVRRDEFGELLDYSRFDRFRHFFNPTSVLALFIALLIAASVIANGGRGFLIGALSLSALLVVELLRAKATVEFLEVKRLRVKKAFRENEMVEMFVEVVNRSDRAIGPVFINDIFGPAVEMNVRLALGVLEGNSITRVKYRKKCNGGMGLKNIGPLAIETGDPFGIFQFEASDEVISQVSVYPDIEDIPQLPVKPALDSTLYGIYEVSNRGSSVCLAGIRPYNSGDSPRHIAWKLSTRGRGLVVKDFEKSVNANVCVLLNLTPNWQLGKNSASTWEYGKDLALAIIQQQIELGNSVGFYSDQIFISPGVGEAHFQQIARRVASLKLNESKSPLVEQPLDLIRRYQPILPPGSEVLYVVPFNELEIVSSEKSMRRLVSQGFRVGVVFVDSAAFWAEYQASVAAARYMGTAFIDGLEEAARVLRAKGIRVFIATHRRRLRDAFQNEGLSI